MRIIDTGLGGINLLAFVFGSAKMLMRPSKGGRLGSTVRCKVRRISHPDRKPEDPTFNQVIAHLEKYGVNTFSYNYDGYHQYFSVRKTQADWAEWLYNGGRLRTPKKGWKQ